MTINELFIKLFGSNQSKDEFVHLEHWQQEGLDNAKSLQELLEISNTSESLQDYQSFDVESALSKNLQEIESTPNTNGVNRTRLFIILSAIALLIASFFFYKNTQAEEKVFYADQPGINMIENGSEVILNEKSNFTFNFEQNNLELKGEAFFDVSPQEKAFTIDTEHGRITILGTSFNVNTTENSTTLYMHEGKVKFEYSGETYFLSQGEKITIGDQVELTQDDSAQLISYWHDKVLNYKNVALTNVLGDINRLYNSNLSVESGNPDEIFITSTFENNSLEDIVKILEAIAGVSIK
jgi:ferric-dicitrate binding protein FerR (iron transport regulator)